MTTHSLPLGHHSAPYPMKFGQPTLATCPYREVVSKESDSGPAHCQLLQQITEVTAPDWNHVEHSACVACCESFPPTVDSWNPIVASLLLNITERISEQGGVTGCSAPRAEAIRQQASVALEISRGAGQMLRPLRANSHCVFLGVETALERDSGETCSTFACHHPAHETTTVEGCRHCRDWSATTPISRRMTISEMVPRPTVRSGSPVIQWSIGVVTAPRREATLEWCLDSIVRAGWERPHLFIDGLIRLPERYLHLPVTWRQQKIGAWPNTYLALMEMIQRDPQADAYLLLQDDAVLYDCDNLREYLESMLWPVDGSGIVSLFCPQPYNRTEPGWHTRHLPWVWGAQTFLFSREAARELVSSPDVIAHRWTGRHEGRVQVDVLIGKWAQSRGRSVWFPNPSLAQHVGNTSSIWESARIAGWRRADWFAGDLESPFSDGDSQSHFVEDRFPCPDRFRSDHQRRITVGRDRMAKQRLVICGLCRNVRHFLPKFAARVEKLGRSFRDYRVVLFENDSTDATVEFLLDWQRVNDRVHLLTESLGHTRFARTRSADRATRLADYRNRYRQYSLENFGDFDHVLVCDTDLAGGWSFDGLADTFGQDDWDFVGSSGWLRIHGEKSSDCLQFDSWAFRAVNHPQPHSNHEVNSLFLERGEPMVPVWSCFGGVGVYRMEAWKAAEYGGPDCEHVVLHQRLRQAGFGRLFLNPSQIVLYSPE